MEGIYLDIDASDLNEKMDRLRNAMTEQQFTNAMYGIFKRTGGHVRKILKSDLPHKYEAKPKEIGEAVKKEKVTSGGLGVGCSIPIRAARKGIGGKGFPASGGRNDKKFAYLSFAGKRYRVKAKIVKDNTSVLPQVMNSYGGQTHFRNLGAAKLNNLVFTRAGRARLPIEKVSGIAIPQMPMNRSEPEVQKDIRVYLEKEMERRFNALLINGR